MWINWTLEKFKKSGNPPPPPPPFQVYPPFLAKHFVSPKVTQFSEGPTPPPPSPPKENFNMLNLKNLPLTELPDCPGKARHYLQRGIKNNFEKTICWTKASWNSHAITIQNTSGLLSWPISQSWILQKSPDSHNLPNQMFNFQNTGVM